MNFILRTYWEIFQPTHPRYVVFKYAQYLERSESLEYSFSYLLVLLEQLANSDHQLALHCYSEVTGLFCDFMSDLVKDSLSTRNMRTRADIAFSRMFAAHKELQYILVQLENCAEHVFLRQEVSAHTAQLESAMKKCVFNVVDAMQSQLRRKDYFYKLLLTKEEKKCIFRLVEEFSRFKRREIYKTLNVYEKVAALLGPISASDIVGLNRILTKTKRTLDYYGYTFKDVFPGTKSIMNLTMLCR